MADEEQRMDPEMMGQMERTYKGIVFRSVEEKDNMIQAEAEFAEFCTDLTGKSFWELWSRNEAAKTLPPALAAPYRPALLAAMNAAEQEEKAGYETRIENAKMEELDDIISELNLSHYSPMTANALRTKAQQRKALIQRQMDQAEDEALKTLCQNMDTSTIAELQDLKVLVKSSGYQERNYSKYLRSIDAKIEYLHVQNMEAYCSELDQAGRDRTNDIKALVDGEDCRIELKQKFYARIGKRNEELDFEDLSELTSNLGEKPIDELANILSMLEGDAYNKKFTKAFYVKTRKYFEKAQLEFVENLTSSVSTCDAQQLDELSNRLNMMEYDKRLTILAEEKIADRRFELDMLSLLALGNNFDAMDLQTVQMCMAQSGQMGVSQRSQALYQERLKAREHAIALTGVSVMAKYLKGLMDKYAVEQNHVKIPGISPDYKVELAQFYTNTKYNDTQDIPLFILTGTPYIAMTRKILFYKEGNEIRGFNVGDIHSFAMTKKLLLDALGLNLRNGVSVAFPGAMGKKNLQQLVLALNEFLMNMNNPAIMAAYQPDYPHVDNFDPESFAVSGKTYELTADKIANIFLNGYFEKAAVIGLPASSVKSRRNENWGNTEMKLRAGLGIVGEKEMIWYFDRSILGLGLEKNGLGIGLNGIHMKNNNQNQLSVQIKDIYQVEVNEKGNGFEIQTSNNASFFAEVTTMEHERAMIFVNLVEEYVKGIQLIQLLSGQEDVIEYKNYVTSNMGGVGGPVQMASGPQGVPQPQMAQAPQMRQPAGNACRNCGAPLAPGVKFCARCGAPAPALAPTQAPGNVSFCPSCGNAVAPGTRFCMSCGFKIQ
ncbi:MAG: zinc ribbon domain-containing protein [Lachnospiraceae bacterium]